VVVFSLVKMADLSYFNKKDEDDFFVDCPCCKDRQHGVVKHSKNDNVFYD
jgi:hypothetical protein